MITGDLVKCNKTGSLGVVTQIVDKNPHTGNIDWIYHVLWTEATRHGHAPGDMTSWERLNNFTPLADEEYAA
jgi:hypothetical protein